MIASGWSFSWTGSTSFLSPSTSSCRHATVGYCGLDESGVGVVSFNVTSSGNISIVIAAGQAIAGCTDNGGEGTSLWLNNVLQGAAVAGARHRRCLAPSSQPPSLLALRCVPMPPFVILSTLLCFFALLYGFNGA